MPNGAVGALEVYGWPPFLEAVDAALKAADVMPLRIDSPGIALMSLYVQGDVGAVRAAVEAGLASAKRNSKAVGTVIANPSAAVFASLAPGSHPGSGEGGEGRPRVSPSLALAALQTDGLAPLVEAADVMLKTANVRLGNYQWVGLRCHTVCLVGEIGDARAAIESGVATAKRSSSEVFSCLLANPTPLLGHYLRLEELVPKEERRMPVPLPALGVLEAKGASASAAGTDAMFKAARVRPVKFVRVGLAWLTSFVVGELGAVRTAIEAGQVAASRVDETISCVIPNPLLEAVELFGIPAEAVTRR